jgi:glycosyltransferase involved in cell wall biosynthesis
MRIVYITAGAGGMYCGSCMKDNTLVTALVRQRCEALLVPTYTPIRTDEKDVSQPRIFFGGINVFLQQKVGLFRHTPWFFDRLLDLPRLLRWASRFAVKTRAEKLGDLTVSMLRGHHGHQRKEVDKLVSWLAAEVKPDLINLPNALLSGMVPDLKSRLGVPLVCTLQGDDVFLESLPQPHRGQALDLIREHCRQVDGFIATSADYADFMAGYFAIPRERIHVVYPGLNLAGHGAPRPERAGQPFTIGYFARICPEKGLHLLVEAFCILRQTPGLPPCRLRISGWLGAHNQPYLAEQHKRIQQAGLGEHFEHVESPDQASKVRFLQGIDVLSVPATFREPKGLYVLEALANGLPVVQPRHGSFPELVEATGGGLLVNRDDPHDLARGLRQFLENPAHAEELGRKGREMVHQRFHADQMARDTLAVYARYVAPAGKR